MNFAKTIAKTTLAGALSLATSCVFALPVDVNYALSGSAGDWLLNFTVTNNTTPSDDLAVFLFGVQLQSAEIVSGFIPFAGPFDLTPSDGGPVTTYDFGWLDFGAFDGTALIPPTASLGGFALHNNDIDAPGAVSWAIGAVSMLDLVTTVTYQGTATLPAVPEPSTYALMFLGLAALKWRYGSKGKA